MAAYFISDLHLSAEVPHIYEAFKEFLTRLQAGDDLYILGDFLMPGSATTKTIPSP